MATSTKETTRTKSSVSTFTSDPVEAISTAFSRMVSDSAPTPALPSPAEIEQQYAPLLAEVQATQPPGLQGTPRAPSPIQSTLALFAANLGAALTRNPEIASNVMGILNRGRQQIQDVQAQNYAVETSFNKEKQMKLLGIRADITEKQLNSLIDQGKLDDADKKAKEYLKLQETMGAIRDQIKNKYEIEQIRTTGEEARKTQETRAATTKPELSLGDLLKARNDVLKSKELNLDQRTVGEKFVQFFTGKKPPQDREEALDMIEGAAVVEGSDRAKAASRKLLFSRLLQRYENDTEKVVSRWRELALPDDQLSLQLFEYLRQKHNGDQAKMKAEWVQLGFPEK